MSRPPISTRELSESLTLSECHPTADHRGRYWIYDGTQEMNLAMGSETEESALLEVLEYYQDQLEIYKDKYRSIKSKVSIFIDDVECDLEI